MTIPQDTLRLNDRGDILLYDHTNITDAALIRMIQDSITSESIGDLAYSISNNQHNDSILNSIISFERLHKENKFLEEKEYYDNLGTKIELVLVLAFIAFIFYAVYRKNKKKNNPYAEDDQDWIALSTHGGKYSDIEKESIIRRPSVAYLTYKGKDLNFYTDEITAVLNKRFPYFTKLSTSEKHRFLQRHKKFMSQKIFRIYDKSGFKEMPILISATAIQLSFGLEEYLLAHYKNISIFPQEFLGVEPHIRFLEGNVSGNTINISWKHYLKGYENVANGQNVGLHEMAHAYYCQNMICEDDKDHKFVSSYGSFDKISDTVFKTEISSAQKLYSDYGLKNLQEFWAESIEIFFERPTALKEQYPELYETMSVLLNQHPL